MNPTLSKVFIMLGALSFGLAVYAEDKVPLLVDAVAVKEFASATMIYSPKGFSNPDGRIASYVSDRGVLKSLRQSLSEFPAKGGVYKMWPGDIAHWRFYIHGEDNGVIALNVYGYSLQSPLDDTFVTNTNDPKNTALMRLLESISKAKK